MDFMPLRLNSSSLICSICALAAIILQLAAMEWQKLHIVDWHTDTLLIKRPFIFEDKPIIKEYHDISIKEADRQRFTHFGTSSLHEYIQQKQTCF